MITYIFIAISFIIGTLFGMLALALVKATHDKETEENEPQ